MTELPADQAPAPEIDTNRPHPARMYDFYLGGKNHFAADRETAGKMMAAAPSTRTGARENRAFLGRAVRFLAAGVGVRQFLDIGTGLPTTGNVHEVAQAVAPSAASSTPTTTLWFSPTPGRCSRPPRRAAPPTSTPICGTRTRSCLTQRSGKPSISASRSR